MKTKYSIGIPAYKIRFLDECIKSVLNQTYKNFELIIINDCSPEPIKEVVCRFDDNRIKYFENEINFGSVNVVKNWNKCLEKAIGEYFILLGDDDKMEPNYLEEFNKLILEFPEVNVYHSRVKIINEFSQPVTLSPICPKYETIDENMWHRMKGYRLQFCSEFVYQTETLKKNHGFFELPDAWFTDDITAYIACKDKGIAYSDKALLNYRDTTYTITSSGNPGKKIMAVIESSKWFINFINEKLNSEGNNILYNNIKEYYPLYYKKNIKSILENSYKDGLFKRLFHWIKFRKKYKLKISFIFYTTLIFIKNKLMQNFHNI